MYNIHLLPALFGDAILIEYGKSRSPRYILIDGGPYYGYEEMLSGLRRVAPKLKRLELLVTTHIDIDHIDGIISLLNQSPLPIGVKEIWFNGFEQINHPSVMGSTLGALQGEYLSGLIKKHNLPHNTAFDGQAVMVKDVEKLPVLQLPGGFEITLLTPSKKALQKLTTIWKKEIDKIEEKQSIEDRWRKEKRYGAIPTDLLGGGADKSIANMSSIAFLGTYEGKSCLYAGDAPSAELLPGIQALANAKGTEVLQLNAWKLAHHGSKRSTSEELMKHIAAEKILVSTNGAIHHLPDKSSVEAVMRLSRPESQFYFNYLSDENKIWSDSALYPNARFPEETAGITVRL